MSYHDEIAAARLAAARADARVAAHDAGVVPDRLEVFLRSVDLSGNPDEATVRDRVKAALTEAPEFDARRRTLGALDGAPPSPVDEADLLQTEAAATLAAMQSSVGIAPVQAAPAAPAQRDALGLQVDNALSAMKAAVGIA